MNLVANPALIALREALDVAIATPLQCNEAALEALLYGAVVRTATLSRFLTHDSGPLAWALGRRNAADLCAWTPEGEEVPSVVVEVKVRAAFNWSRKYDKSQMDVYAEACDQARLVLVASDRKLAQFDKIKEGPHDPIVSHEKWNLVSLRDLARFIDQELAHVSPDPSAALIGRIATRGVDNDL